MDNFLMKSVALATNPYFVAVGTRPRNLPKFDHEVFTLRNPLGYCLVALSICKDSNVVALETRISCESCLNR